MPLRGGRWDSVCAARLCVVIGDEPLESLMTNRRTDPSLQDINRGMLVLAAALVGVGSLLGLAGFAVSGAAAVAGFRRWYRRADLPPHELARLKWEQAKAAAGAGTGAWREAELAKYTPRSERTMR
jgi:hypothetical protein